MDVKTAKKAILEGTMPIESLGSGFSVHSNVFVCLFLLISYGCSETGFRRTDEDLLSESAAGSFGDQHSRCSLWIQSWEH